MSHNHRPRKRFGQHFLRDESIIQSIVASIAPKPDHHLVEIGPGQGAMTLPLLREAGKLDVVEIDRDLIEPLREKCARQGGLTLYNADALRFDFLQLQQDQRPLRLTGNLPYNISTPLIFHLITFAEHILDMHFMLQKEVALRLAARPHTADYGRLSIMVQYHCDVQILFDVDPLAFDPPPRVQSSIVRLIPYRHKPYVAKSFEHFSQLVKIAFSQRRKTLRNNLKKLIDLSQPLGYELDMNRRPEELSVSEFVELSNALVG